MWTFLINGICKKFYEMQKKNSKLSLFVPKS